MITVLIPAYRPDKRLIDLVASLKALEIKNIVAVNDGSGEAYREIFDAVKKLDVVVLEHKVNLGKGAALKTGFKHLKALGDKCRGVVTADADGQHTPEDIKKLYDALKDDRLILGTRDFSSPNVPARSKTGNRISCLAFKIITGRSCPDTQTGLRAIPASLFD